MPGHFPRLLGAVPPFQGFIENRHYSVPARHWSISPQPFGFVSREPGFNQRGNCQEDTGPQPEREKQRRNQPCSWRQPWSDPVCRASWLCSLINGKVGAFGNHTYNHQLLPFGLSYIADALESCQTAILYCPTR